MKQSLVYGFAVSALLVLGGAKIAFADVAPPVGYVEQCTVEKQQAAGKACVACKNDYTSFVGDAGDRCAQQYEPMSYTKVCKSYGASAWTEVWCTGDLDAGSSATTPVGGCSGCHTNVQRTNGIIGLLMLSALASARLLQRRSRK